MADLHLNLKGEYFDQIKAGARLGLPQIEETKEEESE